LCEFTHWLVRKTLKKMSRDTPTSKSEKELLIKT